MKAKEKIFSIQFRHLAFESISDSSAQSILKRRQLLTLDAAVFYWIKFAGGFA